MGFTQQDLESFHRFAVEKLSNGAAPLTLEECLHLWRAEHEEAAAVADIKTGMEDEQVGRLRPLREVDAEIRQRLGFSE